MKFVFMVQYSHNRDAFDGWYNLRAFTTLESAEEALRAERDKYPTYRYCINSYKLED